MIVLFGRGRRGVEIKLLCLIVCASLCWLPGCSGDPEVVVVSKTMHQEANVNPGIPDEFAQSAPSSGQLFWVEGTVRNTGSDEVRNVEITFVATDGNNRTLMIAKIDKIAPGETVPFSTGKNLSPITLRLVEEEPEISIGR